MLPNYWEITESLADVGRENQVNELLRFLPAGHRGVPAACRVVCYDRSLVLAKSAAVRLMQALAGDAVKPDLAAEIRKPLAACRRPPSRRVLNWLEAEQDPRWQTAVRAKIIEQEDDLLLRRPRETLPSDSGDFVAASNCRVAAGPSSCAEASHSPATDEIAPRRSGDRSSFWSG